MDKLIIGGGLLGTELHKQTRWDLMRSWTVPGELWNMTRYKVIINCMAHTDTSDNTKETHWEANYVLVKAMIDFCNQEKIKLIHISTDYIYSGSKSNATEEDVPVHNNSWYSYTKLVADALVQLESNDYLICRGTHKPFPFPYPSAWIDQSGNFDYVHVIADLIIRLINEGANGVYNVGTNLKTMYELKGFGEPIWKPENTPGDITMNTDKLKKLLK